VSTNSTIRACLAFLAAMQIESKQKLFAAKQTSNRSVRSAGVAIFIVTNKALTFFSRQHAFIIIQGPLELLEEGWVLWFHDNKGARAEPTSETKSRKRISHPFNTNSDDQAHTNVMSKESAATDVSQRLRKELAAR
jgi:hypothetical protein